MKEFEVNFTVGHYMDPERRSGFVTSSTMQYLTTRVTALHYSQAQQMVESQYGGPLHCIVHRAIIV